MEALSMEFLGDEADSPSTGPIEEDERMMRGAPLLKRGIQDALQRLLEPVAMALQKKVEDQRKRRKQILAQEEKKLAQRRRMIQWKRRRAGPFKSSRRVAFSTKSSRRSVRLELPPP